MLTPLRIFIGWDSRESIAYHVLCHSILRHASGPVAFIPLIQSQLRRFHLYDRPPDARASSEFTLTRFLVPYLSQYEGISIFLDCDMLICADVFELLALVKRDHTVYVCQHDYRPRATTKFLGHEQAAYPKKNWSSVMVFRNEFCKMLTPPFIHHAMPKTLHRFDWTRPAQIGSLPLEWNYLVGEEHQSDQPPKNIHWTGGGPWFRDYAEVEYASLWFEELDRTFPSLNVPKPAEV